MIGHIKSNIIPDFTGTVTVFNSLGSTQTANATDLVLPSDWNSVHNQFYTLIGNTSNASTASGTNVVFSGGQNISLVGSGSVIGINGPDLTPYLTTAALSNHSHGNPTLALTNLSGTTASNSAGLTLSLSAAAQSAQPVAASGSNGSFAFSTLSFGNLNGLSFYTSNGSIVGSYTDAGAGGGITAFNVSAGTTSGNLTAMTFADGNGVSFGLNAGTLTASVAAAGGAQTAISGIQISNNTYTSGTVTWQNANGISFGSSGINGVSASYTVPTVTNSSWTVSDNGTSGTVGRLAFTNLNGVTLSLSTGAAGAHTIVGSHNAITTGRASNDAVGLNTALTAGPLAWTVNSAGISLNAGSAAGTTSGFGGNLISGSMTHNSAGLNLSLNHPAWLTTARGSTDAVGLATAQTNVTWTINSAGLSLNAGGYAGTTTGFTGANISGSMTHNSAGLALSLSVAAPGGGGAINVTAGTASGNLQTIQFADSNGVSFGLNGSTITASVNAGGGAAQTVGGCEIFQLNNATTFSSLGQNSIYLQKFVPQFNVSFNNIERRMSGSSASSSIAVNVNHTIDYGLYSLGTGASTSIYSRIATSQMLIQASYSSNLSAGYTISQGAASRTSSSAGTVVLGELTGFKHLYLDMTNTITVGGKYGIAIRISSATTGNTGAFRMALKEMSMMNNLTIGKLYATTVLATNASFVGDYAQAVYSATSSNLPDTIAISGLTNAISQMRQYVQLEV